jgi:hypothetical protein
MLCGLAVCQNPPGFAQYVGSGMNASSSPFQIFYNATMPPVTDGSGYTKISCTLGAGRNNVILFPGQNNFNRCHSPRQLCRRERKSTIRTVTNLKPRSSESRLHSRAPMATFSYASPTISSLTMKRPASSLCRWPRDRPLKVDLARTIVVTEPLPSGLTKAENVALLTDRGLHVTAESCGQSVLLLPIQFSRLSLSEIRHSWQNGANRLMLAPDD